MQNADGVSVPNNVFDEGSFDSCGEVESCVVRMDELLAFDQLSPDTFIIDTKYVKVERLVLSCAQEIPMGIEIGAVSYTHLTLPTNREV